MGVPINNKDYRWKKISFSTNASNAHVDINIFLDGKLLKNIEIPLLWNSGKTFPITCGYNAPLEKSREQLCIVIAFVYMSKLFDGRAYVTPSIPKNFSNDILFLLTFKDCNEAYVISNFGRGTTVDDILSLNFNQDYQVLILFKSNKHKDSNGKMFTLNAKSWDKIELTPTTRR